MKKSIVESRTTAKSKLELFVTKTNCWKPLTFVTKSSILDFAVVPNRSLKGTLLIIQNSSSKNIFCSILISFYIPWSALALLVFAYFT